MSSWQKFASNSSPSLSLPTQLPQLADQTLKTRKLHKVKAKTNLHAIQRHPKKIFNKGFTKLKQSSPAAKPIEKALEANIISTESHFQQSLRPDLSKKHQETILPKQEHKKPGQQKDDGWQLLKREIMKQHKMKQNKKLPRDENKQNYKKSALIPNERIEKQKQGQSFVKKQKTGITESKQSNKILNQKDGVTLNNFKLFKNLVPKSSIRKNL